MPARQAPKKTAKERKIPPRDNPIPTAVRCLRHARAILVDDQMIPARVIQRMPDQMMSRSSFINDIMNIDPMESNGPPTVLASQAAQKTCKLADEGSLGGSMRRYPQIAGSNILVDEAQAWKCIHHAAPLKSSMVGAT